MHKILIVDDEESIRFSLGRMLNAPGNIAMAAKDFSEAKKLLCHNRFDVVIVDRLLGPDDGINIIKYANKVQPFCSTILMSSFPTFKSASEGIKHKIFAYLQKPIKKDDFCEIIKNAVRDSHEKQKIFELKQKIS